MLLNSHLELFFYVMLLLGDSVYFSALKWEIEKRFEVEVNCITIDILSDNMMVT